MSSEQQNQHHHGHSDGHHHHGHHGHRAHAHGHGHGHGHDYVKANVEFFDNLDLNSFNKFPHAESRALRTAEAIKKAVNITEESAVMEFACGTGLVSDHLEPLVKTIVGVDISQAMVDAFNKRFEDKGVPKEKAKAVKVELTGQGGELGGQKFDVIFCASAYHHLPDVNESTKILTSFLKPNGALVVIDITGDVFPAGDSEKYKHIVTHHHGFKKEDMAKIYEGAGLTSFDFSFVPDFEDDTKLFCAVGRKEA